MTSSTHDTHAAPSAPLKPETLERFAREVAKYPEAGKQSAVMACLAIVQQDEGFVSAQREREIAEYLGMAPIAVHEVTTFYNMYNQHACLLYTSPSPRDLSTSRMPSSA